MAFSVKKTRLLYTAVRSCAGPAAGPGAFADSFFFFFFAVRHDHLQDDSSGDDVPPAAKLLQLELFNAALVGDKGVNGKVVKG